MHYFIINLQVAILMVTTKSAKPSEKINVFFFNSEPLGLVNFKVEVFTFMWLLFERIVPPLF